MAADDVPPRTPFDVAAYAAQSQRQGKGLAAMHTELNGQLRGVRRELHSLINHRYEDFLGLSTSLTEVDATIGSVKAPLADIRSKVQSAHCDLAARLDYVDSRLRYRAAIREKRLLLRLFIDLAQLLDRADAVLEEAAAITAPAAAGAEYAKCLERAAVDVSQIRYFTCKGSGHPFVQQAADRVRRIEDTLLAALGQLLTTSITRYLNMQQQQQEAAAADKGDSSAVAMIALCLRAYSTVEEDARAEDILRDQMVKPLMADVLGDLASGKGMGMDPQVFASMLQQILTFMSRVGVPLASEIEARLPGSEYALESRVFWREIAASLMNALPLLFVPGIPERFHHNYLAASRFMASFGAIFASVGEDRAVGELLGAEPTYAEFNRKWQLSAYYTICKKHIVDTLGGKGGGAADGARRGLALSPALGAAGSRPGTPSSVASQTSRATPTGGRIGGPETDDIAQAQIGAGLYTESAAKAMWAIARCWAPRVYIEPLASRFWQLTVQILMWYCQSAMQELRQLVKTSSGLADAGALESPEVDGLLQHVHDSFVLRVHVADQMRSATCRLPEPPSAAAGEGTAYSGGGGFREAMLGSMEAAVDHTWAPLVHTVNDAVDHLASTIVTASCANLASQLRRTTSLFRHTNREPPTTPSPFVAKLFALLSAAEARVDSMQRSDDAREFARITRHRLRTAVCAAISREMATACSEALATISKTEASLLRLRRTRAGSGAAGTTGGGTAAPDDLPVPAGVDLRGMAPAADNDKIRRQVWLDVAETARIIAARGAQPHGDFAAFEQLIAPLGV
ncbi:hypothetical protein IWQ57_002170 [Coemansia nantahalensis]|uniref:Uncharacterized protein n=1 Tax=Coemansia nantahalensis TaxID=2789366 RepID=A0ACC1K1P5_9FUNG|nr:hypothetical protein IWQ57_002170 [Coemansia nantahalensis]